MARHFEPSPFFLEQAICANEEGAALNAFDLLAVHDLVFNNSEHVTHFFFSVGDQLKRQFEFHFEFFMRAHVVTGDAKNCGARFYKIFVFVAKLHGFGGAAWRVVLGVKIQDDHMTEVRGIGDPDATSSIRFKSE